MATVLPAKYNLLLFLGLALLYPAAGVLVGEPFTEPTIVDVVGTPAVLLLFGNIGFYLQSRRNDSGVVDERDVRNIDFALAGTGVVVLVSIIAIYLGYARTNDAVPVEIDYLALVGVVTMFVLLAGTELYQRL